MPVQRSAGVRLRPKMLASDLGIAVSLPGTDVEAQRARAAIHGFGVDRGDRRAVGADREPVRRANSDAGAAARAHVLIEDLVLEIYIWHSASNSVAMLGSEAGGFHRHFGKNLDRLPDGSPLYLTIIRLAKATTLAAPVGV